MLAVCESFWNFGKETSLGTHNQNCNVCESVLPSHDDFLVNRTKCLYYVKRNFSTFYSSLYGANFTHCLKDLGPTNVWISILSMLLIPAPFPKKSFFENLSIKRLQILLDFTHVPKHHPARFLKAIRLNKLYSQISKIREIALIIHVSKIIKTV